MTGGLKDAQGNNSIIILKKKCNLWKYFDQNNNNNNQMEIARFISINKFLIWILKVMR